MEVLVSWIFSSEESSKVETEVRATLKDDPRMKLEPERMKVVEHILDVAQNRSIRPTFESVFEKHIPDIWTIWTQVLTYNKHINFLVSGFNGTSFYASPTRGVHDGFTL